jgi:Tol biopolymer transport system component
MNADGTGARQLQQGASPRFSADGQRIVFQSGEYGRSLTVMDVDGLNVQVIAEGDSYKSHPSFSSDGQRVLYLDEPEADGTGTMTFVDVDTLQSTPVAPTIVPES